MPLSYIIKSLTKDIIREITFKDSVGEKLDDSVQCLGKNSDLDNSVQGAKKNLDLDDSI